MQGVSPSPKGNKKHYYAVFSLNGGSQLIICRCNEKIQDNVTDERIILKNSEYFGAINSQKIDYYFVLNKFEDLAGVVKLDKKKIESLKRKTDEYGFVVIAVV